MCGVPISVGSNSQETDVACGLAKSILAEIREWKDEKPLIRAPLYWINLLVWAWPLSEFKRKFVPRVRTNFGDYLRYMGSFYVAAYRP